MCWKPDGYIDIETRLTGLERKPRLAIHAHDVARGFTWVLADTKGIDSVNVWFHSVP
jgi:hypothetical protein